jgi:hypothetical protein
MCASAPDVAQLTADGSTDHQKDWRFARVRFHFSTMPQSFSIPPHFTPKPCFHSILTLE